MSEPDPPRYTRYRARRRLFERTPRSGETALEQLRGARGSARSADAKKQRKRLTPGRVLAWLLAACVAWIVLSVLLFLISAQIERSKVSPEAQGVLAGKGAPPFSATTVLVLGSDKRTKGTREPGASTEGPSRSDSILLMRVGGGHNGRLSIPRDTVVDIPGHGRDKINAAYAIGGASLAVQTIQQFLGIRIDHIVEVNFDNFPDLIDAMGGIDYTGGCVVSRINGGFRNGGFTLRLRRGTTHINGRQALALARTRHNLCNARESDLTRARRQQKLFAAMKHRLLSPYAFIRLPLISWNAPKALRSDMGGPTLLGLFAALATAGSPPVNVLRPSGGIVLPGGGAGLTVSDVEKQREVAEFLRE